MRTIYTPEQVLALTESDLKGFVGKYVGVEMAASEWYKENVGGDWEGGSGICSQAGIQKRKAEIDGQLHDVTVKFVMWGGGMGWSWRDDQVVHVAVCDEHGDHRVKYNHKTERQEDAGDPGAAACLATLGVRGR